MSGAPTSHAVREPAGTDALVSVSTWRSRPGGEQELERLADKLMDAAAGSEGHLSGTVLHDAGSADYHFVHRFEGPEAFARWHHSPERVALHRELDAVAERQGAPQRITGLETWFLESGTGTATLKPPLILLSVMTYAMMPLVTRLLRGWLYPDDG